MANDTSFFRRHLPHVQPDHGIYFITTRLAGSLPRAILERLEKENLEELEKAGNDTNERIKAHRRHFKRFDESLDRMESGPKWMRDRRIATLVADSLRFWDGKRYELLCYTVMPNHIHVVFRVGQFEKLYYGSIEYPLSSIMHSIKRYTARRANELLRCSGPFWQHESYDHLVRSGRELERIVSYTKMNPVKAGLVSDWSKWEWSYVNEEGLGRTI